ncbi:pentapeptide repeat-containing protein [Amycolatopsis sp. NPDC088138]|uniref:pentapeptide repeat-containing protein n=1 Tax=Amycolatopsis sp. NPDC088138 TaxID=3363938 RepID=UPI0038225D5C
MRATAQQIVKKHLTEPNDVTARTYYSLHGNRETDDKFGKQYWPGLTGDLTGTTLVDFDASDCWIDEVDFSRARFTGQITNFSGTYFSASPKFDQAKFTIRADFSHCYFNSGASFQHTLFAAGASFREAYFTGPFSHVGVHDSAMDTTGLRNY